MITAVPHATVHLVGQPLLRLPLLRLRLLLVVVLPQPHLRVAIRADTKVMVNATSPPTALPAQTPLTVHLVGLPPQLHPPQLRHRHLHGHLHLAAAMSLTSALAGASTVDVATIQVANLWTPSAAPPVAVLPHLLHLHLHLHLQVAEARDAWLMGVSLIASRASTLHSVLLRQQWAGSVVRS